MHEHGVWADRSTPDIRSGHRQGCPPCSPRDNRADDPASTVPASQLCRGPPSLPDTLRLASQDWGICPETIRLILAHSALETTQDGLEGCPATGRVSIPRSTASLKMKLSGREGVRPYENGRAERPVFPDKNMHHSFRRRAIICSAPVKSYACSRAWRSNPRRTGSRSSASSSRSIPISSGCLLYTSPSPRDGLLSRMP